MILYVFVRTYHDSTQLRLTTDGDCVYLGWIASSDRTRQLLILPLLRSSNNPAVTGSSSSARHSDCQKWYNVGLRKDCAGQAIGAIMPVD